MINELIQAWIGLALNDTCTAIPGFIHSYNSETNTCAVQPAVKMVLPNGVSINYPVLGDCSVVFPSTPRSAMSFPIEKGDPVLIVFSQRSLDQWEGSQGDRIIDPLDSRMHNLSDAIVIPGLFPSGKSPVSSLSGNTTDLILAHNIGTEHEATIAINQEGNIDLDPVTKVTVHGDLQVDGDTDMNGYLEVASYINAGGNIDSGGTITAVVAIQAPNITATGATPVVIAGGNMVTTGVITAGSVVATTVTASGVGLNTHGHPVTGTSVSGGAVTGTAGTPVG